MTTFAREQYESNKHGLKSSFRLDQIADIKVPLPPIGEQKAIVKRLEELLALEREIAADSAAIDDLITAAKKKILDLAISGKLVPKTGEWKSVKFEEVVDLISGRDLLPSEYSSAPLSTPYITGASNFERGGLVVNRWTDSPSVISVKGDLLITCKGTIGELSFNQIGSIHIARQIMALRPRGIDVRYLRLTILAQKHIITSAAHGVIPGVSRKDMLSLRVSLPPHAEQKAIVKRVEELFAVLRAGDFPVQRLEV